jgi:hypothetical protein
MNHNTYIYQKESPIGCVRGTFPPIVGYVALTLSTTSHPQVGAMSPQGKLSSHGWLQLPHIVQYPIVIICVCGFPPLVITN